MSVPKESCPIKAELLAAWQEASELYSRAVADLTGQIGIVPRTEYRRLSEAAETERRRARQAQAKLEKHTAEHGCDGHGEAVA